VHQYAKDVVAGKITAGKRVRQACLRHLRDMERQGTEEFPYVFDDTFAERFFNFAALCRHVQHPLHPTSPAMWTNTKSLCARCLFGQVHRP